MRTPTWTDKFAYTFFPVRRKTVLSNMRTVFGSAATERQIVTMAQLFYGHFLKLLLENVSMIWMSQETLKKQVRLIGHEHLIEAGRQAKGVLLLTGHFGNWELAPVAGILHFQQFRGRFHIVRRQLVNKFIERVLFGRFYKAGLNVIPKKKALSEVMERLADNDAVAFIMDQHAKPEKDGVAVDFFGRKAGTFKSLAIVARLTGAPVIPTFCYRDGDGKHVMRFSEPLDWIEAADPDREIEVNTRNYNRVLESMLLERPEQWMWFHKRWKLEAV